MKIISKRANGTIRVQTDTSVDDNGVETPDMAQQQYKESCDINVIMKKYENTGLITHLRENAAQGRYATLGEPQDLMDALNIVNNATARFMELPAELRAKCNHQPENFLKMLQDGSNDEELYKLGIKIRPQPPVMSDPGNPGPKTSDSASGKS